MSELPILDIKNLTIEYESETGTILANRAVSIAVNKNEIVGIVGPNACGKSTLLKASMGLLMKEAKIVNGTVSFEGKDITEKFGDDFIEYQKGMSAIRGKDMAMIFQEPSSYFDPLMSVSDQMIESIRLHQKMHCWDAKKIAIQLLTEVGIDDAKKVMKKYPVQLSGGLLQKVMIAMALINKPKLIVADEPFSDLDEISENIALEVLLKYCHENNASMLLVSHDLELMKKVCDNVYFMYEGEISDFGKCPDIFEKTTNPFFKEYIEMKED